ncbi:hypothetical protein PINS_up018195 [Pythium insidiosum]|nr:hypothetical protein PINS_up018195 [Pythium insidiosum]
MLRPSGKELDDDEIGLLNDNTVTLLLQFWELPRTEHLGFIAQVATSQSRRFFIGIGVVVDTDLALFNCVFTVLCVLIMLLLSGLRRRREGVAELLSTFYAGVIAYVVTAVVTSALFFSLDHIIVDGNGFAATLGFQLFLVLWFAYDASSMYGIMSPDEYMQCVIYFYTDLIVLVVVTAVMTVVVLALLVLCRSDDSNSRSSHSDHSCGGDGDCCDDSCWRTCLVLSDCDNSSRPSPTIAVLSWTELLLRPKASRQHDEEEQLVDATIQRV